LKCELKLGATSVQVGKIAALSLLRVLCVLRAALSPAFIMSHNCMQIKHDNHHHQYVCLTPYTMRDTIEREESGTPPAVRPFLRQLPSTTTAHFAPRNFCVFIFPPPPLNITISSLIETQTIEYIQQFIES
jgi:hypothetical protein